LTTIYVTHGHGDHFLGIGTLLDRFPYARAVAKPDVVKLMRQQASPEFVGNFWSVWFPGQIADRFVIADELEGNVIDLAGHDLVVVEVGHTDTYYTICLHVPPVGLVVAGDVAYNDVHLYLAESNAQTRREWIAALDTIESINPRVVIAGHKRSGNDDRPIIDETRHYIRGRSTTRCWSAIRIGPIRG
jgi:glyoxylase-like metal-dependent hydrolase (beta-lactamase superfamily II)